MESALSPKPSVTSEFTPTQTLTPTLSSTPTETTTAMSTSTQPMSEDEIMIRDLLEKQWVEAYNSHDIEKILRLYTDNASLIVRGGQYAYQGLKGENGIYWHYWWHRENNSRLLNYKIKSVDIAGDKAKVYATYGFTCNKASLSGIRQYELVKITKITKGNVTTRLPKPMWKIDAEQTNT